MAAKSILGMILSMYTAIMHAKSEHDWIRTDREICNFHFDLLSVTLKQENRSTSLQLVCTDQTQWPFLSKCQSSSEWTSMYIQVRRSSLPDVASQMPNPTCILHNSKVFFENCIKYALNRRKQCLSNKKEILTQKQEICTSLNVSSNVNIGHRTSWNSLRLQLQH